MKHQIDFTGYTGFVIFISAAILGGSIAYGLILIAKALSG